MRGYGVGWCRDEVAQLNVATFFKVREKMMKSETDQVLLSQRGVRCSNSAVGEDDSKMRHIGGSIIGGFAECLCTSRAESGS